MLNQITFSFFLFLFTLCSCTQRKAPNQHKYPVVKENKSFEEQALEVLNEVVEETKIDNNLKLKENEFSEGVQEIIEWFDYQHPVLQQYRRHTTIGSNDKLNLLLKDDPLSIKSLDLINNPQSDPLKIKDISAFKNLEFLKLNNFDSIPNGFYGLSKLKVFIATNQMRDKMTSEISHLKDLEYIQSLFTHLELHENIYTLEKLNTIVMYNFSTKQPYERLYKIPNLKSLSIRYSEDSQLDGISNLKNLKTFITNRVNAEVGDLNLTGLNINENNDKGYPENLGKLKNLVAFYWQGNNTMETAPEFVSNLGKLEYLEIRGCSQFKNIPNAYDDLKNLKQFDIICRPKFTGKIDHLKKIRGKIKIK